MDCDGLKKALLEDGDGSLLGHRGTVVSDSAFGWDVDPARQLGDNRIPIVLLTAADGSPIPPSDVYTHPGKRQIY